LGWSERLEDAKREENHKVDVEELEISKSRLLQVKKDHCR
jgi:hypothetical protein